jgi:hypothetical protein
MLTFGTHEITTTMKCAALGSTEGNIAKSYSNNCAHGTSGICPSFHSCLAINVGFAGLNTLVRPITNVNRAGRILNLGIAMSFVSLHDVMVRCGTRIRAGALCSL